MNLNHSKALTAVIYVTPIQRLRAWSSNRVRISPNGIPGRLPLWFYRKLERLWAEKYQDSKEYRLHDITLRIYKLVFGCIVSTLNAGFKTEFGDTTEPGFYFGLVFDINIPVYNKEGSSLSVVLDLSRRLVFMRLHLIELIVYARAMSSQRQETKTNFRSHPRKLFTLSVKTKAQRCITFPNHTKTNRRKKENEHEDAVARN